MAISFEESLKKAREATLLAKPSATIQSASPVAMSLSASPVAETDSYGIMTTEDESGMIAAYAGDSFTLDSKYRYYPEYHDDTLSKVDNLKNITLDERQINITQETNSQYIPFQMPRFYDGFDLTTTTLMFHFVNKNGYEDYANPVNVYYSSDKIKFAWLVDKRVTAIDGKVKFEIQAVGVNSKGDEYVWKTKPYEDLNVLKSLSGNGIIEPDNSWVSSFMTQITEQVGLAQAAAQDAANSVSEVEAYANAAAESAREAQSAVDSAKNELEVSVDQAVDEKVSDALADYYTKNEVDTLIENIDISDQLEDIKKQIENIDGLAAFNVEYDGKIMTFYNGESVMKTIEINSDPSAEWTTAYSAQVDEKISAAKTEVQNNLNEYKEIVNADLESIHEDIDDLPETLATDYYNKTDADATFATKTELGVTNTNVSSVTAQSNTNKDNITELGTQLADLQTTISEIDTSPRKTYDVAYNDAEDPDIGENNFVLYEIENEGLENEVKEIKKKFTIVGGSGGGSSTTLKIEYITTSPVIATVDDTVIIKYNFSGTDSSGDVVTDGTATWKVAGRIVATNTAVAGENEFDITQYITLGTQKVNLQIVDDAGSLVSKTWTVQKVDVRLESDFNDTFTYPLGDIAFNYTPYGAISKDVHFVLDGEEIGVVTTSASGIPMGYTLPSKEHGAHLLEVYMTATVNNNTIESNHIFKDILWYDATSGVPVIGCINQDFTARQYDTTNIIYTVHDPSTETPDVTLAVDGIVVSELTLDSNTQTWQYKSSDVGEHILTITCGETIKTIKVNIEKLNITIEPVTAGLVIDFNPVGKSNSDADRVWNNGTYAMSVSDNFDWVNGGYQIDSNGDQYFCIKAGTSATINYNMFADDAKRNGKELKLVFKTTNVQESDAQFLSCINNTTGSDHIGIEMFTHEAMIYGSADKLQLKYSEGDIIEFEFNITKDTEKVPEICGYEDGVATRHLVYDGSFNFTQNTPKPISLGSEKCDLHIYRMKIYNTSLSDKGILNNFIADARNADEMISRYNRNQIYNENQELTPQILAEKCPWLRVYIVSAPYFTNKKSDKVPYTTIQQIYKNGDPILDNWICYDCSHSGQGTSSDNYGAATRNLDFIMNKSQIDGVKPYFILGDGATRAEKVSLTRESIPVAYLNFKANVASSNHFTNALLAKRYNEFNPYNRPFAREDASIIPYIKDTMEFHNAVVFIQETDEDLSTHREFADTAIHFYSIGNIGDSKKTDDTRLNDPSDRYECINEICDVELPLSDWPNTEEAIAALEAEKFDKSGTYEWRYIWEDGTDEENEEVREYCKQRWIEMYKFVVQSTDEEFKAHFGDYFVLDSVLYYYLFTTRYCMVDNRAKNSFWHYAKTGEVDTDGNPVRKWDLCFMYDCDSSMSLNNYGNSVYRHGYEDTDAMDGTDEEVFRESDSTFFCRVRDSFAEEMAEMYNTLESKNAWHAESFLNEIETWQKQFPEELWRVACQRTYIRSYSESFINGAGDPQFLKNMAQGRMLYAVKQWERSQEAYMASKYQSSVASSDNAVLRCTVPTGNLVVPVNYKLKLTPYDYMYLNVKYGTQEPIQVRANPGVTYEIPFEGDAVDIIDIYSASRIQDLGDLSSTYPTTVDTAKASRLKELHVGNSLEGYDNPYLTTMTLGANYLLEVLNVENVSGLTQSLDLSALNNLRELYAHGTNTGGVTFASGGAIRIAELPAVTSMSAKNLAYLTDLDIESYDKLTTLTVENCSTIDVINVFELSSNLNRVRITGIDWVLTDTSLLERIYGLSGLDKNGYNVEKSVLAGSVHVPVIKQQQFYNYKSAWPDLEISYDTLVEQFAVTFVNDDGSELEVQYVDKGSDAIDPTTREENPLIPEKESSVSHDFTFIGWDSALTSVFADRIITATYTSSLRTYTIKYVSKGVTKQESSGLYGENIPYSGETPTYTLEESAYTFYLFNRWDKSGFIDGEKTVNAIFDKFTYTSTSFDGRDLKDLSPVEIYALTKLNESGAVNIQNIITNKDPYTIVIGNDIEYDDIDSKLLVSKKTYFSGSNYLDTGIRLFDEDKDFVLAIDYEFLSGNTSNAVLAQCFQSNGTNGFKLWYSAANDFNGAKFTWGTSSDNVVGIEKREIIVLRHKKGENNLTIYKSNMDGNAVLSSELTRNKSTIGTGTLVFGAARADDGIYENHAIGNINWAKVWFADLGEDVCKDLAIWTHESIKLEACGFRKYYLSDNTSKRCTFSLLAAHLLGRTKKWNSSNTNDDGWAASELNTSLNTRLFNAMPVQIKQLLKRVIVKSNDGIDNTSAPHYQEVTDSNCYITVPALIEVDSSQTSEPYNSEGIAISYMSNNSARKRSFDNGDSFAYWTRTPNVGYPNYIWRVDENGAVQGISSASTNLGVLIEISF